MIEKRSAAVADVAAGRPCFTRMFPTAVAGERACSAISAHDGADSRELALRRAATRGGEATDRASPPRVGCVVDRSLR